PPPPRSAPAAARRRARSEPAARAPAGHGDPPALGRWHRPARLPRRRGRASFRRRRLRPARAGDRLDPAARPAGGWRADLAPLPRRRRGRLRQRRQLGAVLGPHARPMPPTSSLELLPWARLLLGWSWAALATNGNKGI